MTTRLHPLVKSDRHLALGDAPLGVHQLRHCLQNEPESWTILSDEQGLAANCLAEFPVGII